MEPGQNEPSDSFGCARLLVPDRRCGKSIKNKENKKIQSVVARASSNQDMKSPNASHTLETVIFHIK
jgi:hypothetical protein